MPTHQLATCTGCGETNENRRWIQPASRAGHYLSLCRVCESTRNRARRVARASGSTVPPITSARLGIERRFGIEIECIVPGGRDGSTAASLRAMLPPHWTIGTDSSIGSSSGIEIRSPILKGEDGLRQAKQAFDAAIEVGCTVTRRCGLHVHHEARDLGRSGLVTFVRSWAANQELIDWLVSPSRRGDNASIYCQRWQPHELTELSRWNRNTSSHTSGLPSSRYRTANLHTFARYGTVEIRQHQGTLSFRKVEAWIKLTQGLLDSLAGRIQAHGTYGSLQSLFEAASVDEDTSAYLLGRAMQFGAGPRTLGLAMAA